MSEYLDKTYVYIMKNFIRFGILLLIVGILLLSAGIAISSDNTLGMKVTIAGGFVLLSGSLFTIASAKPR